MGAIDRVLKRQLDKLDREFIKIDRQANRKIVLPAVRKGVRVLKRQAKRNAKWKSLRKLIKGEAFLARRSLNVIGKIFLGGSKDRTIKIDGREVGFEVAGSIIEFGRAAPGNKGGEKVVKPQPFMRSAADQKGGEAMKCVEDEMGKRFRKLTVR